MENSTPQAAPASRVFANLAAVLRSGWYPGEMCAAVGEGIAFCDAVAKVEAEKELHAARDLDADFGDKEAAQ